MPPAKHVAIYFSSQARINRSGRETIQPQQDMGEQDTMKRQCYIRIDGDIIDTEFIGHIVSMDIDSINNIGIFELSDLIPIHTNKELKND